MLSSFTHTNPHQSAYSVAVLVSHFVRFPIGLATNRYRLAQIFRIGGAPGFGFGFAKAFCGPSKITLTPPSYLSHGYIPAGVTKKSSMINHEEERMQARCFQGFWNKYPLLRRCLFSVPNGGTRNALEVSRMKAGGLVPGIPDMIFVYSGRAYGIEMKTEKGVLSDEQVKCHRAFDSQGVPVYVVRSEEQFWAVVESIMGKA